MKLTDKQYNTIKWIVLTVLPAMAVLMGSFGEGMHLGWTATAILVINAVDVFVGTITGVSSVKYNKLGDK